MTPVARAREDFDRLVEMAMQEGGRAHMRPVIEKELIHYDILHALEAEGLLAGLTFQGGTALRLIYGGSRFSEDLDFVGGYDFNQSNLQQLRSCVMDYLGDRYGLETSVKAPKETGQEPVNRGLKVAKWQLSIQTAPERPDLPRQRIKIEVANIPAYTRSPEPLRVNYHWLPEGYAHTLVQTESLEEILADKLVSLPNCSYLRYRDIWDIAWLTQAPQLARLDPGLISKKLADYSVQDYQAKIESLVSRMPEIVRSRECRTALARFLPMDVQERTLEHEQFNIYLTNSVAKTLTAAARSLAPKGDEPEFVM